MFPAEKEEKRKMRGEKKGKAGENHLKKENRIRAEMKKKKKNPVRVAIRIREF